MQPLQARKSLGQNFLVDPKAHARIVKAIAPQPEDSFIEIGPGTGLLTKQLLSSPLKKLIAFELDSRAIPLLEEMFASEGERFKVVEQDFLEVELEEVANGAKLRVAGNIPYYITSPIIFKLIDERESLRDATLLVQLEVAERLVAKPNTKAYGIPTVLTNFFGKVEYLFKVPAGAFRPVPRVDSGVIRIDFEHGYFARNSLTPPEGFDPALFRKLVRGLFAMRRKTIRNNIKSTFSQSVADSIESSSLAPLLALRAEALGIDQFVDLTMQVLAAIQKDTPPSLGAL